MTRVFVDEEELEKIYGVIAELSEQLNANRTVINQLKSRSESVKGQATHVGTGFPLRRFNLDIADEEFSSELEKFASHLVLENQSLQHENKQLNGLLKEYESTLENVMSKFRGVAHASQQHDLSLHSYYTTLLSSLQTAHSSSKLHDDTTLSLLLSRLSTLLRTTLRSLGGEEVDGTLEEELSELVNGLESHPQIKQEQAEAGPGPSSSLKASTVGTTTRTLSKPPRKPNPFPGSLPGSSGGYIGTEGHPDWAIEREMEIMRLEDENASLREMLSIANEIHIEPVTISTPTVPEPETITPPISRKGSIAVEDLEADAAREAEELAHAEEQARLMALEAEMNGNGTGQPSAMDIMAAQKEAANGRMEVLADAPGEVAEDHDKSAFDTSKARASVTGRRPIVSGSVLGFQAGVPPPEHVIADDPDQEEILPEAEKEELDVAKTA